MGHAVWQNGSNGITHQNMGAGWIWKRLNRDHEPPGTGKPLPDPESFKEQVCI